MRAQIGRLILAFAAFAAIAGSQTESYDVRHVRWGMSMAEVEAAEPNSHIVPDHQSYLVEYDSVVGLDSVIFYNFNDQGLSDVSFYLSKTNQQVSAEDADHFLYRWDAALNKKYGTGYICLGESKVCHRETPQTLEDAKNNFVNHHRPFSIQFDSSRTLIFLHMEFDSRTIPDYVVHTDFETVPKDNF